MRSRLVDVAVVVHHETDRALLVSTTGDRAEAVWLPRSACEFHPGPTSPRQGELTLEEQLAIDKGLV